MDLKKTSKAKENSSLKANRNKQTKTQTPSKPYNKKYSHALTPKQYKQTLESLKLPVKEQIVIPAKEVTQGCSAAKSKIKHNKNLFYRKHYYNNKEITEICDLTTGPSTYRSKATPQKYIMGDFNEIQKIDQQLVNVSPFATNTHYTKTEWKELYPPQRCHCRKSACKANYCPCHNARQTCSSQCQCHICHNGFYSKTEQLKTKRSPSFLTFREQKSPELSSKEEETKDRVEGRFCKCGRNDQCIKSTCGCRKLGVNCSKLCQCIGCQN